MTKRLPCRLIKDFDPYTILHNSLITTNCLTTVGPEGEGLLFWPNELRTGTTQIGMWSVQVRR
jgi:hypothetical protein